MTKAKTKMNKIERLNLAGMVAPDVRRAVEAAVVSPKRKIHVVGKDGNVKGYASEADVAKGALALHEIEFGTADGVRPKRAICKACGRSFKVPAKGLVPVICPEHAKQKVCPGFKGPCPTGEKPPRAGFRPAVVIGRGGGPWRCSSCGGRAGKAAVDPAWRSAMARRRAAARTPEQRSEAARLANASRTAEQRTDIARRASAAMTPAQRSERARRAKSFMTPDQRSGVSRRAYAARTPKQRAEQSRRGKESMTRLASVRTPEQRSENARKAWATRRAKAKAKPGGSK